MPFQITGLPPAPFAHLRGLPDDALAAHRARRYIADQKPGFPDRIELREAEPGESVLLVNHEHLGVDSPYRASHAVFVLEHPRERFDRIGAIPEVLRPRMLSLRAFDTKHMMVDADLIDGRDVETLIERMLADPQVEYLHAHFARRGCYACRIDRAR